VNVVGLPVTEGSFLWISMGGELVKKALKLLRPRGLQWVTLPEVV
jgi:hypothetical protein